MIREFICIGEDGHRLAINMASVEAVLERGHQGVQIITSSDTYNVKVDYDEVVALWRRAKRERRSDRK